MLGVPTGVAPALTVSAGFDGNTLVAEEVTPFPVICVGEFESTGIFIVIGARFSSKPCLLLWPTECGEEVETTIADDGKEGTIKPPDEDPRGWSRGLPECCWENEEEANAAGEGGLSGELALASILTRFCTGSGAALAPVVEAVSLRWAAGSFGIAVSILLYLV